MSFLVKKDQSYNFYIRKGFSFGPKTFVYRTKATEDDPAEPIDITGWEVRLVGRESVDGDIVFEASTLNGLLVTTPASGLITFAMTPEQTAELDFDCLEYEMYLFTGDPDAPTAAIDPVLVKGKLTLKGS